MKRSARIMLYARRKKIRWNDNDEASSTDAGLNRRMILDAWPNLKTCVDLCCRLCPTLRHYSENAHQPNALQYTGQFIKSLDRHCTNEALKLQVVDALTKLVYRIPSPGLANAQIKERSGLYHIRVSYFWRLFYKKADRNIALLEFCPHKKQARTRR